MVILQKMTTVTTNIVSMLIVTSLVVCTTAQQDEDHDCLACPGLYCGRYDPNTLNCTTECGACPRGYRSDSYFCRRCEDELELYDWLYIGFMSLTVTVLNLYAIGALCKRSLIHTRRRMWMLYFAVVCETVVSFVSLILLLTPVGEFRVTTCRVASIKDWYTVFFNPIVDYRTRQRCTVEAVYPLYTAIFINLFISFLVMVLLRGVIIRCSLQNCGRLSFYAGLYVTPAVATIHAAFAGVLYYIFPYLVLFLSAVGIAVFLSRLTGGYYRRLREPKNVAVLICYCLAHGYGIVAVTVMEQPERDGPLLLLVLLPFLFYTITRPYTQADNFKQF